LCEAVCVPLGVRPPLFRRRVDFFTHDRAFTSAKATELLGYAPRVDLLEGLRRTAAWYRSRGYLSPSVRTGGLA
jgi:nucleoside-diphosphate-sugar epimerase